MAISITDLRAAAARFDRHAAAEWCVEFIRAVRGGAKPNAREAEAALSALRRKRWFPLMLDVAEALRQSGQSTPAVVRQYAQALIETGRITAAIDVLERLAAETAIRGNTAENAEARGLLGRAYKQIYVTGGAPGVQGAETLRRAARACHEVYEAAPEKHLWHGVNLAACLSRAGRDGVKVSGLGDPAVIAATVLARVKARPAPKTWDLAMAAEACIALGRADEAAQWTARYVISPEADAFELGATRRQMIEVWQLSEREPPGDRILPLLDAMLLRAQGGVLDWRANALDQGTTPLADLPRHEYEARFGGATYLPVKWIDQGRRLCRAIARVQSKQGSAWGTGFLMRGGELHEAWGDEAVLMTNAHVIADDPAVRDWLEKHGASRALGADEAEVAFDDRPGRDGCFAVRGLLWSSPPWELDTSVIQLARTPGVEERCAPHYETPRAEKDRVYVIGHPLGGPLAWSLHDNLLLAVDSRRLHYRAPTDPGSSGSPVFDDQWRLIGLHHLGSARLPKLNGEPGHYEANEAIRIDAIRRAIAARPAPPTAGTH